VLNNSEGSGTYSAVLGLWHEPPDDGSLDGTPDEEDNICLPGDVLQGNRETKLVDEGT